MQDLAPATGGRRSRAYAQAQRHSRRVRFFKRAIPLGAGLAIAAVLGITFFNPFAQVGGLTLGPVSLSGTKVVMESPRLTGFQRDTRPYEVTAEAAAQDVRKPTLVELKTMRGRITLDDQGTIANLTATTGLFDTQKEQLTLSDGVRVVTTSGYSVDLRTAAVDFKAGTVKSAEPVTVHITNGKIDADSLDISDNGKVIVFDGRVRSTFTPPAQSSSAGPLRTSEAGAPALRP